MTTTRKSLHPLQLAAGDKENLVGPGRMIHADKDNLKNIREANENEVATTPQESKVPSNKRKKVASRSTQAYVKPVISEEDLTTDQPSDEYQESLDVKRREALEETLQENETLHILVSVLKEEIHTLKERLTTLTEEISSLKNENQTLKEKNNVLKEMLQESESLVDVLKDMINDPVEESVTDINDSVNV